MAVEPIFKRKLSPAAWQLHWWLISKMDNYCEVRGGWRRQASKEMCKDRYWVMRCVKQLQDNQLIETRAQARWVKVLVANITG